MAMNYYQMNNPVLQGQLEGQGYRGGILSPEQLAAQNLDMSLIKGNNPNYQMTPGLYGASDQIVERPAAGTAPVQANTGNARQSTFKFPDVKIGNNEMLMRTGGAIMGGSMEGGLQAYSDGLDKYGKIQDYNREADLYELKSRSAFDKLKGGNTPNYSRIVNDEIFRAMNLMQTADAGGWFDLGATGMSSLWKTVPGTDAKALSTMLQTIKSNIGFDKLQAMREASPTGGALGQISKNELDDLQAVFGSLDQSQSTEQLMYNLKRLRVEYNDVIHGYGAHPFTMNTDSNDPTGTYQGNGESQAVLDARKILEGS